MLVHCRYEYTVEYLSTVKTAILGRPAASVLPLINLPTVTLNKKLFFRFLRSTLTASVLCGVHHLL